MTRDETAQLLRVRSALTSQPYGDEAIDAWLIALSDRPFAQCRTALVDAAKVERKVSVAQVIERLPARVPSSDAPPACEMCGGDGMVTVWERHLGLDYSAVVPCKCSAGTRMQPVLAKVIADNDAELNRTFPRRDRTYVRLAGPPEPGVLEVPAEQLDEHVARPAELF